MGEPQKQGGSWSEPNDLSTATQADAARGFVPKIVNPPPQRSWLTRCILVVGLLAVAWGVYSNIKRHFRSSSMQGPAQALHENSGLAHLRGAAPYWSIADSGSAPVVYALDEQGRITAVFPIDVPRNVDWEDVASDGVRRLFVADIGDNFSRRDDLSVIEVAMDLNGEIEARPRGVYRFSYPRPERTLANNYDAESLIFLGGQLYIFTKRRGDTSSEVHRIVADPALSTQVQRSKHLTTIELNDPKDWVHFGQMATAAAIDAQARRIAVLTYRSVLVFEDLSLTPWDIAKPRARAQTDARILHLLKQKPRHWALSVSKTRQCEGIVFRGEAIYLSNEEGRIFELSQAAKHPPVLRR